MSKPVVWEPRAYLNPNQLSSGNTGELFTEIIDIVGGDEKSSDSSRFLSNSGQLILERFRNLRVMLAYLRTFAGADVKIGQMWNPHEIMRFQSEE